MGRLGFLRNWFNVEMYYIDESLPVVLFVGMHHFHLWPKAKACIPQIQGRIELYTGTPTGTAHAYNFPLSLQLKPQ
jgi:hypothetical protein